MICFFGDSKHHLYVVQKELPVSEEDQKSYNGFLADTLYLENLSFKLHSLDLGLAWLRLGVQMR